MNSQCIMSVIVVFGCLWSSGRLEAQVAIRGETVYTMSGKPIKDGMVVIRDGKIAAVGKADAVKVPDEFKVLKAKVVTPQGLQRKKWSRGVIF